jgi:hypothetical protein
MRKEPPQASIWLCVDWATYGVDNDGDSTVDNEAATCTGPGEGELTITETAYNVSDIDSPNDDDDGDGDPVAPEYCLQFGCPPELGAMVDHDGGRFPRVWAPSNSSSSSSTSWLTWTSSLMRTSWKSGGGLPTVR